MRESWLAGTPIRRSKALAALALPAIWRRVVGAGRRYDWVIASTHLFSHHVRALGRDGPAKKFVYVHSPARYIWNPELDRRGAGPVARAMSALLRPLDRHRAQEAFAIAANSEFVRERVRRAWRRDSEVIHPPVDVDRIVEGGEWASHLDAAQLATLQSLPKVFLLGASRFVPYKRLDLVVRAGEAADLPVVLAGEGPLLGRLREEASRAAVPVHFILEPDNAMLYALYQRSAAFVFPPVEDFGMMPVEAMAAGAPVIANAVGGARESVRPGLNGVLVERFDRSELRDAVEAAVALDRSRIPESVQEFSVKSFQRRLREWIARGLQD